MHILYMAGEPGLGARAVPSLPSTKGSPTLVRSPREESALQLREVK